MANVDDENTPGAASGGVATTERPERSERTDRSVLKALPRDDDEHMDPAEYARLLADHMGRHIAGQPHFIVQSMPGAGGLNATNYLYIQAPQDGTTIGIVHSTVPLAPLWNSKGVRFDTLERICAVLDCQPGDILEYRADDEVEAKREAG